MFLQVSLILSTGACVVAGACMVAEGAGACAVAGGRAWLRGGGVGYDEIRSMSGRYASYWNAFLYAEMFTLKYRAQHRKQKKNITKSVPCSVCMHHKPWPILDDGVE